MNYLQMKILNILSLGLPLDHDIEELRKVILLNLMILLGSFVLLLLGTLAIFQNAFTLMIVDYVLAIFLLSLYFYTKMTLNYHLTSKVGAIVFGVFLCYLTFLGGISQTAYLWGLTFPIVALFLTGFKSGAFLSLLYFTAIQLILWGSLKFDFIDTYNPNLIVRYSMVYLTIFFYSFITERLREAVQHRLNLSHDKLNTTIKALESSIFEKQKFINKLQNSIDEIKKLQGILPICTHCKKIRNDKGYWEQVECYIEEHSDAEFTHGLCPDCQKELFPDI